MRICLDLSAAFLPLAAKWVRAGVDDIVFLLRRYLPRYYFFISVFPFEEEVLKWMLEKMCEVLPSSSCWW